MTAPAIPTVCASRTWPRWFGSSRSATSTRPWPSPGRIVRRARRTALTDTLLLADRGALDRHCAERLLHLSFYPVGSVVELADGAVGLVVATHGGRRELKRRRGRCCGCSPTPRERPCRRRALRPGGVPAGPIDRPRLVGPRTPGAAGRQHPELA